MIHTIQHNITLSYDEFDILHEIIFEFEKQGFVVHSSKFNYLNEIHIYCWKECKNTKEVFQCTQRI